MKKESSWDEMSILKSLSAFLHVGCRFCGGLHDLSFAPAVWEYTYSYRYHLECVKKVLRDPEHFGHSLVDIAIDIEERTAYLKKQNKAQLERAHASAERLGIR
jgi:hypothetical protein